MSRTSRKPTIWPSPPEFGPSCRLCCPTDRPAAAAARLSLNYFLVLGKVTVVVDTNGERLDASNDDHGAECFLSSVRPPPAFWAAICGGAPAGTGFARGAGPGREPGGKTDKLAAAGVALAPVAPPQAVGPSESLRLAFASTTADVDAQSMPPPTPLVPLAPSKPKLAGKPPPQKSYALLSDAQIAGIKDRLKLSSSQEPYWPAVENALRAVARKIHETRKADPHATGAPIDPDAEKSSSSNRPPCRCCFNCARTKSAKCARSPA